MKKKILAIGLVLAVLAVIFTCGCVEKESILTKGDEKQVAELIQKECEYMNNGDWKALYECYSPGYRDAYPYDVFAEDLNEAMGLIRAFGGKGKFTVEDVNVSIKGDIAYATFVLKLGGDVVESKTEGDEDLFVRYNGTWYDMTEAEGPEMLGYNGWNEEDAAVLRKAEMRTLEEENEESKTPIHDIYENPDKYVDKEVTITASTNRWVAFGDLGTSRMHVVGEGFGIQDIGTYKAGYEERHEKIWFKYSGNTPQLEDFESKWGKSVSRTVRVKGVVRYGGGGMYKHFYIEGESWEYID